MIVMFAMPALAAEFRDEAKQWGDRGWRNAEPVRLDFRAANQGRAITHEFSPTLVVLDGSGWTLTAVVEDMKAAARIYGQQCGIGIGEALAVTAQAPSGSADVTPEQDAKIWHATPPNASAPTVYYVGKGQQRQAAYSYDRDQCKGVGCDTVWVTSLVSRPDYQRGRRYSTTAHELAHVLGQVEHLPEHVDPENIMGLHVRKRTNAMTADQCSKFKRHPAMKTTQGNQ